MKTWKRYDLVLPFDHNSRCMGGKWYTALNTNISPNFLMLKFFGWIVENFAKTVRFHEISAAVKLGETTVFYAVIVLWMTVDSSCSNKISNNYIRLCHNQESRILCSLKQFFSILPKILQNLIFREFVFAQGPQTTVF